MRDSTTKILVILPMNDEGSRKKLAGIFDYIRESTPWDVILTEPSSATASHHGTPDGIIASEWPYGTARFANVPKIIINLPGAKLPKTSHVICDNAAVVSAASALLKDRGFSSFAYVHDKTCSANSLERAKLFGARTWPEAGFNDLKSWLRALPQRTAVLTADDTVARETMLVCRSLGIRIPKDLAFVGIDNDELLCDSCPTPLTSVEPDFRKGGYMAAKQLALMMADKTRPGEVLFYGVRRIVERASSDYIVRESDPRIEKALVFIRTHATERISVNEIASAVGYSRRTVESLFRKRLRRSVGSILRMARLDWIMQQLKQSSLPISQICLQSGFLSESHAKHAFKAKFGKPMSAFRG